MDRNEAIDIIEAHYPADDDRSPTAQIGGVLLFEARQNVGIRPRTWRDEPDDVLAEYARLCLVYDDRQAARLLGGSQR